MKCTVKKITVTLLICLGSLLLSSPENKAQDTAKFTQNFYSHTVTVTTDDTLGAANLKFLGEITPELQQPQMIMGYNFVSDTTFVLIYSYSDEYFLEGALLSFTGNGVLVYADASDTGGIMLEVIIEVITGVDDDEPDNLPGEFILRQNYPNPFNAGTRIEFKLKRGADVKLDIYDITGKPVGCLHDGYLGAGKYSFSWKANDYSGNTLPSGVYLYRLQADEATLKRKMLLLK